MKIGEMMKTKTKNGKMNNLVSFQNLFNRQKANQIRMLQAGMYDTFKSESTKTVPVDDVKLMSYHVQQLMSEIGEVLSADKRWKNFRNVVYDADGKLEEIADCFIVLMNIAMFSGFDDEQIVNAIKNKISEVGQRIGT